jgi:uncharacterized protein (DUF1800 family)
MSLRSLQAAVRFGLGQRGTEPTPSDPEAWLAAQLDAPDPILTSGGPDLASAFEVCHQEDVAGAQFGRGETMTSPHFIGDRYWSDREWAMQVLIGSSLPFRERLVTFWANHFTVSSRASGLTMAFTGAYVQEAIRPHVTGNFQEMLSAVMHHPAMLYYLNNADSVGPSSETGRALSHGLNENLARECLELHTLGTTGGYSQQDVTSFAKILTGWSVENQKEPKGFVFRSETHEPGPKTIMGQQFPEGYAGGEAALSWLAHHPATYQHIATQLVQHFAADTPNQQDVEHVASALRKTDGNLKAATLAVIELAGAWQPLDKLRSPLDYVVAIYRALDLVPTSVQERRKAYGATEILGQPFEAAYLPNGWSDTANDWLGGESLIRRADLAFSLANNPNVPNPEVLIDVFSPLLSARTIAGVRDAGSRREALALLLASPEFMRR